MKYGIWSLTTKSWVYDPNGDCTYPTKRAATKDLHEFAVKPNEYEVKLR